MNEAKKANEFVWTVCRFYRVLQKIGLPAARWKVTDLIKRGQRFVGRTSDK